MFDITKVNWKKVGIFASGVLFGTAGIKALSSKDAKNVYTNCTAAVLRAKDCVMKTATNIQENAEDIYAEAKNINEERAAEMEEFSDADTAAEAEEADKKKDYEQIHSIETIKKVAYDRTIEAQNRLKPAYDEAVNAEKYAKEEYEDAEK